MPKPTSVAEMLPVPVRVTLVTMDGHLKNTVERAAEALRRDVPGLDLRYHAAVEWDRDPASLDACKADIASSDVVVANMLFLEDHIQAVLPDLRARRDSCDAMVGCIAASEVVRLTRLGRFSMEGESRGPMALLKRLRPKKTGGGAGSGAAQMAMLKRLPKILRFIPGTAQDVRAYFLTLQYWLAGSEANVESMLRFLLDRYADGERRVLRGTLNPKPPADYPEVGLYHPRLKGRIGQDQRRLPEPMGVPVVGTVGLLLMRSYVLSEDTGHYDGVIEAFERRGLKVIPAFANGLDSRPAIDAFFMTDGAPVIDALVSLTGFSLVGGPAYSDAAAAAETLKALDVPYLAAHAVEFQTLDGWRGNAAGLSPIEATMMVALPELDGATNPTVFGGRALGDGASSRMAADLERVDTLARRTAKLVALRRTPLAERKVGVVLFNFPPNAGATGSAAFLAVFESLFNTLNAMRAEGYTVEVPGSVDELRRRILEGNAGRYGTEANVVARVPTDEHVRFEPHLAEIEAVWGSAPGKHNADGRGLLILGERFGNVLVGVQPAFGYEGDPMRLLFEGNFAPTHGFAAFYRYVKDGFNADVCLHFGTHGALEFMPGKQAGMSGACWPDRLIGDVPNVYLYAVNNPSEGALAKRRAAATLVSYLTPSLAAAGLYRGLVELKASLDRHRALPPNLSAERAALAGLIQAQASALDLATPEPVWADPDGDIARVARALIEVEHSLIPHGLHVVGEGMVDAERAETLSAMREAAGGEDFAGEAIDALLAEDHELPALMRALDGRFVAPSPSGDLLRSPAILPTGRNPHGFDPFRLPSPFALRQGAAGADLLLRRHEEGGHSLPETVALVLWGTDNLKNEGVPIAQALALLGALPRFDGYGRLCGAELIPLESLGRPRVDVVVTLSGIFRDLLPLQTKLLAEAAYLAATAEEPESLNFVRKHALAYRDAHGVDLETAALRVFSNADGAYGSNVNQLIENGRWEEGDDLAEAFTRRKCFAYGRKGPPVARADLMKSVLKDVSLAYQNLESVELGVTTVDHYFDSLGGINRAVKRAKGGADAASVPVYIGDQTGASAKVRTLDEQVALETRTRMLNPKWYEGMLRHGYEGVRQIESSVTNTLGWSATTGQVAPWVYERLSETYVLDPAMRERLASLNPKASARVADRLIEASERRYWTPDPAMLEALRQAGEELEDRLEGVAA